jgi:hypothetical protein
MNVEEKWPYLSLQSADKQTLQNLACLIAVSNVFKRLRSVLAGDVEEDFFSAAIPPSVKVQNQDISNSSLECPVTLCGVSALQQNVCVGHLHRANLNCCERVQTCRRECVAGHRALSSRK